MVTFRKKQIPKSLRPGFGLQFFNDRINLPGAELLGLAQILVKGPFQDPTTTTPQTRALDFRALLPAIPGTRIHVGILVAVFAAVLVWFLMSRTAFGLRLQVLGSSMRSARHMGLDVPRLIVVSFLLSGMFVGFAAAVEILGIWGYQRADYNPAFGRFARDTAGARYVVAEHDDRRRLFGVIVKET